METFIGMDCLGIQRILHKTDCQMYPSQLINNWFVLNIHLSVAVFFWAKACSAQFRGFITNKVFKISIHLFLNVGLELNICRSFGIL